ncbi:MAG: response regulator [Bacteroidota bacterium]
MQTVNDNLLIFLVVRKNKYYQMNYRILYIEDEEPNAILLKELALRRGWDFKWYSCADTFLKMANISDYDIIFVDWKMPGMDGLELCKIIRSKSSIPLIICTAYAFVSDKEKALQIADDYFPKPPLAEEFYRLVEKYCRNNAS